MAALAGTALLFSVFTTGAEVVLPLWVTRELGYSPGQWALLRSLRMAGVLLFVIPLGVASDLRGQRAVGAMCMLGIAVALVVLGVGPRPGIWLAMPLFGPLVSTAFVNMNTLTQQVSQRRAPAAVTALAGVWNGYRPVLIALAGVVVASAAVLWQYPGDQRAQVRGNWSTGYRLILRRRELMAYMHLSQTWSSLVAGVGVFAAIRFTVQLGQTDQQFGLLCSAMGVLTFAASAAGAVFMDRVSLRAMHAVVSALASVAALAMGIGDSLVLGAAGFAAFGPLAYLLNTPASMWVSRAGGKRSQSSAFSVFKVMQAGYAAAAMALLGLLESLVGIRAVLLYGGILGLAVSPLYLLLREPPKPV